MTRFNRFSSLNFILNNQNDKMADCEYVLSSLLCYLKSKYGKVGSKLLKSSIVDFYKVEDLASAKRQLIGDIERLHLVQLPHIPERRAGSDQATRIVDDLFTVFTCLDEQLKLTDLPRYVSDSPDFMPSTRLYDGDLGVLMAVLEKIDGHIVEHGSAIAAIARDLRILQVAGRSYDNEPCVINNTGSQHDTARPAPSAITSGNSVQTADRNACLSADDNQTYAKSATAQLDWATVASTPVAQSNRFAVLVTDNDCSSDARPFTDVEGRRSAKRRRRQSRQQQQQQQQQSTNQSVIQRTDQSQQQNQNRPRPARQGVLGTSIATRGLAAAKPISKKAVFCIDNINPSYKVDDVRAFVASLSINVVSCFQVNPRRRRNETGSVDDRKAFRLCIDDTDRNRLLDASNWPRFVVISLWYRKQSSPDNNQQQPAGSVLLSSAVMSAASTAQRQQPRRTWMLIQLSICRQFQLWQQGRRRARCRQPPTSWN